MQAAGERKLNFLASHGTARRWHLGRTHKLPPTQSSQDSSRTSPAFSPSDFSRDGRISLAALGLGAELGGGSRPGRRVGTRQAQVLVVPAGRKPRGLGKGGSQ